MQKYCMLNKASIHQIMAVKILPVKYDITKSNYAILVVDS